jgi:hypothetical protein
LFVLNEEAVMTEIGVDEMVFNVGDILHELLMVGGRKEDV